MNEIMSTDPKEEVFICQYETCKELYREPVILVCCGESICASHVDDLLVDKNVPGHLRCCFCKRELSVPEDGLPKNKKLDVLINLNFNNDDYCKAEHYINTYNRIMKKFEELKNGVFIEKYFDGLKKQIESSRNRLKRAIEQHCDDFFKVIQLYEKNSKERITDKFLEDVDKDYQTYLEHSNFWKQEIKKYKIYDSRWEDILNDINAGITELDCLIEDHQIYLLDKKVYEFIEPAEVNLDEIVGRIDISDKLTHLEAVELENQVLTSEKEEKKREIQKKLDENIERSSEEVSKFKEMCKDSEDYEKEFEAFISRMFQMKIERVKLEKLLAVL